MSVLSLSVPVLCLSVRSCLSVRVCLSVFLSVCLSVAICGPVFFFFSPNVRASSVFDEPVGGQIQQKLPPGETSNEQMRARVFYVRCCLASMSGVPHIDNAYLWTRFQPVRPLGPSGPI